MRGGRLLVAGVVVLAAACSGGGVDRPVHTADGGGSDMELTSPAFEHEGTIPQRYTCDGADVSPPLVLSDLPAGTVSLAVVMDDPDAPRGTWDHWVAFDIPPLTEIAEGVEKLGTGGENSWGRGGYGGPCPPSGTHRYFFTVYALNAELGITAGATKSAVLDAMQGRVLAEATLMARYSR